LVAALCFAHGTAHAQGASIDDQVAQQEFCNIAGCGNGGGQTTVTHTGPDPCYLAQNAVRPCTSADMEALKPQGVDPNLVGTWEIPMKGGLWVLTINANGTYAFRSEAHNGAQAQAGSFRRPTSSSPQESWARHHGCAPSWRRWQWAAR
jgi:hypothetical protein